MSADPVHTPEPWEVETTVYGTVRIVVNRGPGEQYGDDIGLRGDISPVTLANFRRAVDCVNALAGVTNPARELSELRYRNSIASRVCDDEHARCLAADRERDEARAALETATAALRQIDCTWEAGGHFRAIEIARAALAVLRRKP